MLGRNSGSQDPGWEGSLRLEKEERLRVAGRTEGGAVAGGCTGVWSVGQPNPSVSFSRLRDWEALSLLAANAEQMLSPSPFFLPLATLKQTFRDLLNSRQVTLVEFFLCIPYKVH